jgi:hypothetical protein
MLRQVTIKLHEHPGIMLGTDSPEPDVPFDGFGELLGLGEEKRESSERETDVEILPAGSLPAEAGYFHRGRITRSAVCPSGYGFRICCNRKASKNPHLQMHCLWQTSLTLAVMNAILRGVDAVLTHCALLETEHGAVMVLGESGMGKSTASARWRACGGKCVSDDMALLDFSGGDPIYVRRMPTWSACREGKNEWNYPASEEIPVAGVLALGRSESGRDEIVELNMAQFFAQCYRSMFYWNLNYAKGLPEEMQAKLTERIRHFTEIIAKRFPPRALMTVLEGDLLRRIVEDYLQTR